MRFFKSCSPFPFYLLITTRYTTNLSLVSPWALTDWLPKMCSCIDGSSTLPSNRAASYERLGSNLTIFELNSTMRRSRRSDQDLIDSERQVCLSFLILRFKYCAACLIIISWLNVTRLLHNDTAKKMKFSRK